MAFSENVDLRGRKARICKMCGKEGNWDRISVHIEAHHIAGISIPCELCGKKNYVKKDAKESQIAAA